METNNSELIKQKKDKIRSRYKGNNAELIDVIPGRKRPDINDDTPRRVAVYVRVSTDSVQQTSSYELQKNYYEGLVSSHQNWTLVDIYADEGISGTSLAHRDSFLRMIKDCMNGKIDLIITKSVSRFARNVKDCIEIKDKLKALEPPVGIFFESEQINTLDNEREMTLTFIAAMAQEESHIKSNIMNSSIEMRFSRGICLTPVLLGYDHDEDGNLIINEDEAVTIRLIFYLYLDGLSCPQIAEYLTRFGRKTKKGNTTWNSNSISEILRNERYCGEILTRKTYTPDYKDHKSKKNKGERHQYRWKGNHEAIISKDDFIAVQHLINNAKYGNKILPELKIISEGALVGFIYINPKWGGFKAEEYISLARTLPKKKNHYSDSTLENQKEMVDFSGYEVARSQFFNTSTKITVTFSSDSVFFGIQGIRKLNNCEHIEMLIDPINKLWAVRPANPKSKSAVKWARKTENGDTVPKPIAGSAFLKNVFEIMSWNINSKYRATGIRCQKGDDIAIIFNMNENEKFMSPQPKGTDKSVIGYPKEWASKFGNGYYERFHDPDIRCSSEKKDLEISHDSKTFADLNSLNITPRNQIQDNLGKIINAIKKED